MKASNRAGFIWYVVHLFAHSLQVMITSCLLFIPMKKHSPEQSRLEASPTALFSPDTTPIMY